MAIDLDFWKFQVGAICPLDELTSCLATVFNYLFSIAFEEDLADCFLIVGRVLGLGEMPWRMECLTERKVLLGYDAAGDSLPWSVFWPGDFSHDSTYRAQHGGYEFVRLFSLHQASYLQHANGQSRYNRRMLF